MTRSPTRVYFIKPIGMDGPVKVGSSVSPTQRRNALACWSPFPLEIIAEIDGDNRTEARFHRLFLDTHQRLEWFGWSPLMERVVAEINEDRFDVAMLPEYAGPVEGMRRRLDTYTAADFEYLDLWRQYCERPSGSWYTGHMPPPFAFAAIADVAKKARVIDGVRSFLRALPAPAPDRVAA